jgi:hypothetical protein
MFYASDIEFSKQIFTSHHRRVEPSPVEPSPLRFIETDLDITFTLADISNFPVWEI